MKTGTAIVLTALWVLGSFMLLPAWPVTARAWNALYDGTPWGTVEPYGAGGLVCFCCLWGPLGIALFPMWGDVMERKKREGGAA